MLVYIPPEYHGLERMHRVPYTFGIEVAGSPEKHGPNVVWAVADGTAEHFEKEGHLWNYYDYDWSDVDTLCFGHDEESLLDSGKIKEHHNVVTIPQTSLSMQMDQAMAIILAHYVANYPDEERAAKVKAAADRIKSMRRENRAEWLAKSRTGEV